MTRRPSPRPRLSQRLAEARKAIAAASAGVAVMVGAGLVTGSPAAWLTGALAAAGTTLAVFAGPRNADPKD